MSDWVTLKETLSLTLRPIDAWPGKLRAHWQRERSPYSAPLKDTLQKLRRELTALSAKQVVLQIAIKEGQLRLDGLPRAGASAEHPGVILSFVSKYGPLRLAFDRFTQWAHNLRAVSLHLEHLRMAGLYGVGSDGEQYRGWQALPPPPPPSGGQAQAPRGPAPCASRIPPPPSGVLYPELPGVTEQELKAAIFLACTVHRGDFRVEREAVKAIALDKESFQDYYRRAARLLHPDVGGEHERFIILQQAADILKRRHKI
jgi:hypothetical protein